MLAGREAEVPLVTCHCDVKYEILLPHHVVMFTMITICSASDL